MEPSIDIVSSSTELSLRIVYKYKALELVDDEYYNQLNGEYSVSDEPIIIRSVDTNELITLSKTNLINHPVTRLGYITNKEKYLNLIKHSNNRKGLVDGILNPIDITVARNAKNGDILYYPDHLVEDHEVTLINDLSEIISHHMYRWDIPAYGIAHNLYPASYMNQLFLHMVTSILNLRLHRAGTIEANSYHVGSELLSVLGLKFSSGLSRKQQMFLYVNRHYIRKRMGTKEVSNMLHRGIIEEGNVVENEYIISKAWKYGKVSKTTKPVNSILSDKSVVYNITNSSIHLLTDKSIPVLSRSLKEHILISFLVYLVSVDKAEFFITIDILGTDKFLNVYDLTVYLLLLLGESSNLPGNVTSTIDVTPLPVSIVESSPVVTNIVKFKSIYMEILNKYGNDLSSNNISLSDYTSILNSVNEDWVSSTRTIDVTPLGGDVTSWRNERGLVKRNQKESLAILDSFLVSIIGEDLKINELIATNEVMNKLTSYMSVYESDYLNYSAIIVPMGVKSFISTLTPFGSVTGQYTNTQGIDLNLINSLPQSTMETFL